MNFFDNYLNFDLKKSMGICNVTDEFFCLYLNNLLHQKERGILVVVNSLYEANKLYSSLINYTNNVYLFPMDDFLTSEALAVSPDLKLERLETINHIINDDKVIVITNLTSLSEFKGLIEKIFSKIPVT